MSSKSTLRRPSRMECHDCMVANEKKKEKEGKIKVFDAYAFRAGESREILLSAKEDKDVHEKVMRTLVSAFGNEMDIRAVNFILRTKPSLLLLKKAIIISEGDFKVFAAGMLTSTAHTCRYTSTILETIDSVRMLSKFGKIELLEPSKWRSHAVRHEKFVDRGYGKVADRIIAKHTYGQYFERIALINRLLECCEPEREFVRRNTLLEVPAYEVPEQVAHVPQATS